MKKLLVAMAIITAILCPSNRVFGNIVQIGEIKKNIYLAQIDGPMAIDNIDSYSFRSPPKLTLIQKFRFITNHIYYEYGALSYAATLISFAAIVLIPFLGIYKLISKRNNHLWKRYNINIAVIAVLIAITGIIVNVIVNNEALKKYMNDRLVKTFCTEQCPYWVDVIANR